VSAIYDAQGNVHRGAGAPDGGQFAHKQNAKPKRLARTAFVRHGLNLEAHTVASDRAGFAVRMRP